MSEQPKNYCCYCGELMEWTIIMAEGRMAYKPEDGSRNFVSLNYCPNSWRNPKRKWWQKLFESGYAHDWNTYIIPEAENNGS